MPWPQDDSPLAPQPTPFGSALWKLLTNAVPAQLNTAGNLAAGVARPFTNLFGNGGQEFWQGPQNPQAAQDMRQALMTIYGGNALNPAAAETDALGAGIKAYHGSPYDFDRFDASKIGTGEGAQAYGHGLYFAERPGVAQSYRDMDHPALGTDPRDDIVGLRQNWQDAGSKPMTPEIASSLMQDFESLRPHANDPEITKNVARYVNGAEPGGTVSTEAMYALRALDKRLPPKPQGKMYEVNINASPDQFLDWDKPLSEQSEGIRASLARAGFQTEPQFNQTRRFGRDYFEAKMPNGADATVSGPYEGGIYGADFGSWEAPKHFPSKDDALAYVKQRWQDAKTIVQDQRPGPELAGNLQQAGIPGIRYLDQGSRSAGEGTHNYVVFPGNEHLIEIVKKYGLAGAAAAMGMKQADLSQMMGLVGPQNKGTTQ